MPHRLSAFRSRSFRWVSVCLIAITVSLAGDSPINAQIIARAQALMDEGKYEEARLELGKSRFWPYFRSPEHRELLQLTVECSLQLDDLSDAIQRVNHFEERFFDDLGGRWNRIPKERIDHEDLIDSLEIAYQLYRRIQDHTNHQTDKDMLKGLKNARIRLNFDLINALGGN